MKVALYMRVSTEDQHNDNQDLRIREVCEVRGWDIVRVYEDTESGGKRSRPGLDAMLSEAKRGHFSGVVAVKVDRIARSLRDLLEISGSLGRYGVGLYFTDNDIDIDSSQGRLMFSILGAFAEYEREIIRDRTKAGLRRARRSGKKIGRPKIHGSKVVKIQDLHREGLSVRKIADRVQVSKSAVSRILREGVPKGSPSKTGGSGIENGGVPKPDVSGTGEGGSA